MSHDPVAGPTLREVISALSGHLVEVVVAPRGLAVAVGDIVIADPDDESALRPDDLHLVIGVRGAAARSAIIRAGSHGATAVAVKFDAGPDSADGLRKVARDAGVALIAVAPDARWDQVQTLLRSALTSAATRLAFEPGPSRRNTGPPTETESGGDLFALAQTIATLTGGSVSIEDTGSRMLAYWAVAGEIDDLRLRSILGRRGPESYLTLLREWGVYDALRRPDHVVTVPDHPDLGIRRRLAIGVHAGAHQLGSIWVQEGSLPLADTTERVLLGAARLAALDLVGQAHAGSTSRAQRSRLLADGLTGRVPGPAVAADLGLPAGPALLLACDLRDRVDGDATPAEAALRQAKAAEVIAVHAAAYRRSAVCGQLGQRVYALLPGPGLDAPTPALSWAAELISAVRREHGPAAQAAIVEVDLGAEDAAAQALHEARHDADRILRVLHRTPRRQVATLAQVHGAVLLQKALDATTHVHHPGLASLAAKDAAHGGALCRTLRAYLDAFGDVAAVAERLHVHPNTVRYRVRRAADLARLDLTDPQDRLLAALVLHRTLP